MSTKSKYKKEQIFATDYLIFFFENLIWVQETLVSTWDLMYHLPNVHIHAFRKRFNFI